MNKKRKQFTIYLLESELESVRQLAERVAPTKTIGNVIRTCVLRVASDPDLDFIFDPGVCLKLTAEEMILRQKLLAKVIKNLELLKSHGIELCDEEDNGDES